MVALLVIVSLIALNIPSVKNFGELEFWFAMSSANSGIYSTSRMIFGLATPFWFLLVAIGWIVLRRNPHHMEQKRLHPEGRPCHMLPSVTRTSFFSSPRISVMVCSLPGCRPRTIAVRPLAEPTGI